MFYNTEQSRKLQRSSELGLYRVNDNDNDPYQQNTCRYVIVLLITVLVLSLMCIVSYNYLSEPNPVILQPVNIRNENISNMEIDRKSYVQLSNVSYSKEITSEPITTVTESASVDTEITDESPVALEFRHQAVGNTDVRRQLNIPERKSPRPFIYENRDPIPIGFITPSQTSNTQHNTEQYPQTHGRNKDAKNIQEIIKYLTDHQTINESVDARKRNKKRQRGDTNSSKNVKKAKGTSNIFTYTADPFFPYKPQNPSDVNLLATNGFRFAPTVQVEPKKPKTTIKQSELTGQVPNRHAENVPANVNFDSYPAGNENKVRKRKNRHPRPYGNYGYGHNSPYNQQNNFYNQGERQPPVNYWNRFRNSNNRNKIRNDLLHDGGAVNNNNNPSQIMVHLNLYPKKKRHQNGENRNIELRNEEFHTQHNCTDVLEEATDSVRDLAQIKNATEFNQLLQNIKFSYVNHKEHEVDETDEEEKVVLNNNHNSDDGLFQIKDTILKLNEPVVTTADEFKHIGYNNHKSHDTDEVEILKSIGFTVLNSTPGSNNQQYSNNHWYPMTVNNGGGYLNDQLTDNTEHVTAVVNDDFDTTSDNNYNEFTDSETVTLPLPSDIFEKYFNRREPPLKSNIDWNAEMLSRNPNLINHKSHFNDDEA